MARFAAGARRVVVKAVAIGALVAAGWLLVVVFGMLTAAPAAADSTAATGAAESSDATPAAGNAAGDTAGNAVSHTAGNAAGDPAAQHGLTAPVRVSASDNAEAMAGRTVDGLNSQRDPGLPAPSSAGKILDTDGLVPNGGGSGPFGPATGDAVRSGFDPRLQAGRALPARLLPPSSAQRRTTPPSHLTDPRTWTPARIKAAGRGDEGSERSLKVTPQRARTPSAKPRRRQ
ncbi:hypothetical protein ACFQQB_22830 [Nonomuraea rubra]|uniref:hypothetical protein n=1 Tax=Nonomuraea rubra TaxID=46180 RepID=UPI00360DB585